MLKKLTRFVKNNILFIIVLFIASVLRFVAIDKYPPSLNWDEVSHGFNAYSLLKTGEDEWGSIFPTIFRAYGDYKLPFYIYLTAISEFLFGVNEFAVRFPSVLSGIFSVFFTYLLVNELFRQRFGEKPAVLASLLVAVEPWSLFLSRGAFEANLALAFFTAGYYFFVKGLKKNNINPTKLKNKTKEIMTSIWLNPLFAISMKKQALIDLYSLLIFYYYARRIHPRIN